MPRQGLNRRKVLQAALQVIDEHSLDELTMRRLGAMLGVEAPSLYKHIAGKPDILDGIAELVYEEIDFAGIGGSFRDRVLAYSSAFRAALLRHPNAVPVVAMRPVTGEHTIHLVEAALAELHTQGFSTQEGRRYLNVAVSFIVGHVLAEVGSNITSFEDVAAVRRGFDSTQFPHVASSLAAYPVDFDAEFELGISLIVDAIERVASPVY